MSAAVPPGYGRHVSALLTPWPTIIVVRHLTHTPGCQFVRGSLTGKTMTSIPGGPIDYASKHWSGLISDYYAARVTLVMNQALADAKAGNPLDSKAVGAI